MKAARYHPDSGSVSVDEIPVPDFSDDEMLVKIASASLCHSDLMLLEGGISGNGKPTTIGHEGVGYVDKVGKNVQGYKHGDRIGFLYIKGCCFKCKGCQVHNLNCETGKSAIQGFGLDGFFAEYAAVDFHNAVHLPENMSLKTSAPFFCAGITAFHAVDNCELKPGDWLAVVGCGGLGQLAIQYGKAMGFKVVGLDINDDTLAQAKELGADLILNSLKNKDYVQQLRTATNGGANAAAVFSASQAAYNSATKILQIEGVLMVIGLPSKPIQFDSLELMKKLYRIKSESTGPPQKMGKAIDFIAKHNIVPHVNFYKLDQINEMIDIMKSGNVTGRMAVVF